VAQSGVSAVGLTLLNTPTASASAQSTAGSTTLASQTNTETPTIVNAIPGALGIDLGQVSASPSIGSTETVSAEATSSATGQSPPTGSPTPPTNGLGYGEATGSQTGVVGANLNVTALSLPLLGIGLVKLTPTGNSYPNDDYSSVAQNGSAGAPQLQTFNATANTEFADLSILNFTGALGALFPGPLLDLNGFQQTASACAKATAAPSCTAPPQEDTGTLSILGGAPIQLSSLLGGLPLGPINSLLTGINLNLGGLTTVGITGTGITVGNNQSPGLVPSPLTVNLQVQANLLGINLLNLTINITLGSASASASYS
jgi:hypothetical protein